MLLVWVLVIRIFCVYLFKGKRGLEFLLFFRSINDLCIVCFVNFLCDCYCSERLDWILVLKVWKDVWFLIINVCMSLNLINLLRWVMLIFIDVFINLFRFLFVKGFLKRFIWNFILRICEIVLFIFDIGIFFLVISCLVMVIKFV